MTAALEQESPDFLICRISGLLTQAQMEEFQQQAGPIIAASGRLSFMIVLEGFEGWEKAQGWEDASFAEANDQYLKKFAIVGAEEWRDKALMFTLAGLRPVPIEYFNDEPSARAWLAAD